MPERNSSHACRLPWFAVWISWINHLAEMGQINWCQMYSCKAEHLLCSCPLHCLMKANSPSRYPPDVKWKFKVLLSIFKSFTLFLPTAPPQCVVVYGGDILPQFLFCIDLSRHLLPPFITIWDLCSCPLDVCVCVELVLTWVCFASTVIHYCLF